MNKAKDEKIRPFLEARTLAKRFIDGGREINILNGVDLTIHRGDRLAIVGSSGSGKSTLLHLLSGLDLPTSGEILIEDRPLVLMNANQRAKVRNQCFGFVYQFHHLLPEFTALENVRMPLLIGGHSLKRSEGKAKDWLERVGLSDRLSHKPSALSGGERQRVAIARAMVTDPLCLFADEPTGNLDVETAAQVLEVLLECNRVSKTALVMVTHDMSLAGKMDKTIRLVSGKLE
jgi:lipoprotein-releasing system ATP-binding protein